MNIFVLDQTALLSAQYQCDKHVVKMVLESAQLLSSVYEPGKGPYKRTHYNHPCAIWARTCYENWVWLLFHADALSKEYTYRYGRVHACDSIIGQMALNQPYLPAIGHMTPFAQCMPDIYKNPDPVVAYRNYYLGAKQDIAKWNKGRGKPDWYNSLSP